MPIFIIEHTATTQVSTALGISMYKRIIFSLIMAGTISFSFAEKKKSSGKKNQYKKQNRDRISEIVLDKEKKVEEYFLKYLKKSPDDLESMYGLVLSYTKQDKLKEAVKYMQLRLKKGSTSPVISPARAIC